MASERITLRLDSGVASVLGPEGVEALEGSDISFASGTEAVQARVVSAWWADGGLTVVLEIQDQMPDGMASALRRGGDGLAVQEAV